ARTTGAGVVVHKERIEKFGESCTESVPAVTARALAPLKILCDQAFPLIHRGAIGLSPMGQHLDAALTAAAKYWRLTAGRVPRKTRRKSSIIIIHSLEPVQKK